MEDKSSPRQFCLRPSLPLTESDSGRDQAPPLDACRERRVINSPSGAGFYGATSAMGCYGVSRKPWGLLLLLT
jgi:hypothetical protein